jgi:hypothetical protein
VVWQLRLPGGATTTFGDGAPSFTLTVLAAAGLAALRSLDELRRCEADMAEHLDLDGDLRATVKLRGGLADGHRWVTLWRRLEPLLRGRERAHAKWVQNHCDADDIQLEFVDTPPTTPTRPAFADADESLESRRAQAPPRFEGVVCARRRPRARRRLRLGAVVRYAGRRGVRHRPVLSRNQLACSARS